LFVRTFIKIWRYCIYAISVACISNALFDRGSNFLELKTPIHFCLSSSVSAIK
jgi:hypothetical protein